MLGFYTLDDVDVQGKRVILRLDLNVPIQDGHILDTMRIEKSILTLKELLQRKAAVFILAHLGRPKGEVDTTLSLEPVANELEKLLNQKVYFAGREAIGSIKPGEVAMLENIRFHPGEEENDNELAMLYASLGNIFVNDAFSVSHRAHASVDAIARILPSVAGRQLEQEIDNLSRLLNNPQKPVLAIVGGSKISTKIKVLERLMTKVDILAPVGGIANTFLKAQGYDIQKSLVEDNYMEIACRIMKKAKEIGCKLFLPTDVIVAEKLQENVPFSICTIDAVPRNTMILDMGPQSVSMLCDEIKCCKTVLWNGPLGACEINPFNEASLKIAKYLATQKDTFSIVGGGETVMTLRQAGVEDKLSYVSTAGGSFLEFIEGKTLPGIRALEKSREIVDCILLSKQC